MVLNAPLWVPEQIVAGVTGSMILTRATEAASAPGESGQAHHESPGGVMEVDFGGNNGFARTRPQVAHLHRLAGYGM